MPPSDFYRTDELFLDEEARMSRDAARAFVRQRITPRIRDWDRGDPAPHRSIEEAVRATARALASDLGIFGANLEGLGQWLPAGEGFDPISNAAYGAALRELEAGDSTLRSLVSVQGSLGMTAILRYGSDAQRRRWLPALRAGEALACFGLTEAQGGSDPGRMETTAIRDGAGWTLDGGKVWITNPFADVAVIWARAEGGIRGFLVERGTAGFAHRTEEKWAFRAGAAGSLSLSACRIGADAILPGTEQPAGRDLACALSCLTEARYGICWGVVGAARACFEEALSVCRERSQFGGPLAGKQEVQRKLVAMLDEVECSQLVALRLAHLKDRGALSPAQVSLAKLHNVSRACEVARTAVELLPADVFAFDAHHAGRHFRNLQVVKKYEGAHEIHVLVVGREITGIGAF